MCVGSRVLFIQQCLHSVYSGKEYVCILRLHSAIESEAKLAQVCCANVCVCVCEIVVVVVEFLIIFVMDQV